MEKWALEMVAVALSGAPLDRAPGQCASAGGTGPGRRRVVQAGNTPWTEEGDPAEVDGDEEAPAEGHDVFLAHTAREVGPWSCVQARARQGRATLARNEALSPLQDPARALGTPARDRLV